LPKIENYRVAMNKITMLFGDLVANDNVTLKVLPGEIHGLIGENGAGKSTLMSILFGLLKPTSGSILLNGNIERIKDPNDANALGIGMVHQHFQLVDDLSVLENIILGNEPGNALFISLREARKRVESIFEEYGFKVDLDKKTFECSIAEQQKIEILKMLYLNNDVLIFDEPSAVLIPDEIDNLLKSILSLKEKGKTIILITHKLNEIKAVCDNATVLRRGKVVDTFRVADVSVEKMSEMMVGKKIVEAKNVTDRKTNDIALSIKNLTCNKVDNPKVLGLKNFSIDAYRGEVLAFAGVEGNGQRELFEILLGIHKPSSTNSEITFINKQNKKFNILKMNIKERYFSGISYVPINRHRDAVIDSFAIKWNITLNLLQKRPFSYFGIINRPVVKETSRQVVTSHDVRGVSKAQTTLFSSLSGGNQQKAVVGREIEKDHDILVLFQPTRGLDVGAIQHIHNLILKEKNRGSCILLISYELDEILALADRVVAMSKGERKGIVSKELITRKRIGRLIAG